MYILNNFIMSLTKYTKIYNINSVNYLIKTNIDYRGIIEIKQNNYDNKGLGRIFNNDVSLIL